MVEFVLCACLCIPHSARALELAKQRPPAKPLSTRTLLREKKRRHITCLSTGTAAALKLTGGQGPASSRSWGLGRADGCGRVAPKGEEKKREKERKRKSHVLKTGFARRATRTGKREGKKKQKKGDTLPLPPRQFPAIPWTSSRRRSAICARSWGLRRQQQQQLRRAQRARRRTTWPTLPVHFAVAVTARRFPRRPETIPHRPQRPRCPRCPHCPHCPHRSPRRHHSSRGPAPRRGGLTTALAGTPRRPPSRRGARGTEYVFVVCVVRVCCVRLSLFCLLPVLSSSSTLTRSRSLGSLRGCYPVAAVYLPIQLLIAVCLRLHPASTPLVALLLGLPSPRARC